MNIVIDSNVKFRREVDRQNLILTILSKLNVEWNHQITETWRKEIEILLLIRNVSATLINIPIELMFEIFNKLTPDFTLDFSDNLHLSNYILSDICDKLLKIDMIPTAILLHDILLEYLGLSGSDPTSDTNPIYRLFNHPHLKYVTLWNTIWARNVDKKEVMSLPFADKIYWLSQNQNEYLDCENVDQDEYDEWFEGLNSEQIKNIIGRHRIFFDSNLSL